jgi:hypothetical protein
MRYACYACFALVKCYIPTHVATDKQKAMESCNNWDLELKVWA